MEKQHHLWELVARKLSCEASSRELAELELMIQQDHALSCTVHIMETLWQQSPVHEVTDENRLAAQLQQLAKKVNDHLLAEASRNG